MEIILQKATVRDALWRLLRLTPIRLRRSILFFKAHKRIMRLNSPKTFNEKVNWRILNDRRPALMWTCDKVQMKSNVARIDSNVLIPKTLWQGTDLRELNDRTFPERWILKANHRSQCVYIGKGRPDFSLLEKATKSWMQSFQAANLGEWAYTVATPSFLLEEWIGDGDIAPTDYKFFVFNGVVRMIQVDEDRFQDHKMSLFDRDWNNLAASKDLWGQTSGTVRPDHLDQMIRIAEVIGSQFDFMRIDLFDTPNGIYFGETTPYPGGGLSPFTPRSFDVELGTYWDLPDPSNASGVNEDATQRDRRSEIVT
ncbi:ATP-grasp fold amidoligase family protein [Pseudarthrobacter sp. 1C304]|uniref:ATP-grasp fold amidoligase family protein n=1 Tax=Pseudarthrobacter sp. 1C304 TaxID=3457438 RepID=UPI003FD27E38